ncbi:MAG: carboxypeptidase regulatory-like domain-containing protein [Firmicutes bacterium]|nr:carboxypeptidase regulatory-like domain-containing protein [Bacillota bacterium]
MGLRTSWRTLSILLIACVGVLVTAMSVAGCFGGGGGATPTVGVIKGYVTEIDAAYEFRANAGLLTSGPGVEGASVSLVGTSKVATTNHVGEFTLSGVAPGTYDILVTKHGWASAIAYGVYVQADRTTEVALRMVKPGGMIAITESVAPTVSISCPSPVSGTGYVFVNANDGAGMAGVLLLIDNLPVYAVQATPEGTPVVQGTYMWETYSAHTGSGWHDGEHVVTAIALDTSGNIGCRSITVTVNNGTVPGSVPYAPTNVTAQAATIHYSVFDLLVLPHIYQSSAASSAPAARILKLAESVRESTSRVQARGTPAGSDAAVACGVSWLLPSGSPPATGFKVYRDGAFVGESPAQPPDSGTVPLPPDIAWLWLDGSPTLRPGSTVSYNVSGYNRSGEGLRSASDATTPLYPLAKVSLTGPPHGLSVSATPLFSWTPVPGAELYLITVVDETTGRLMWQGYASRYESSVYYGDYWHTVPGMPAEQLYPGTLYAWYVMAIASTPDPPIPPGPTWSPDAMAISASDVWMFRVQYSY